MKSVDIKIGSKNAVGFEISLQNAKLVLVRGKKGYVMCGYLNLETAQKLGDAACIVTSVNSIDDLLAAKVIKLTPAAEKLGIKPGISGKGALEKLM